MNNIFENKPDKQTDYIKRFVEKDSQSDPVYSPMDPPDAYKPQGVESVPYEELHAVMQLLIDEHKTALEKIAALEATLIEIKEKV